MSMSMSAAGGHGPDTADKVRLRSYQVDLRTTITNAYLLRRVIQN